MRYLVNSKEMKDADTVTIRLKQVPSCVLMERAALAVVEVLLEKAFNLDRVLVVCGTGNNGGDGFAAARLLAQRGCQVEVVLLGKRESCTSDTRLQIEILENYGVSIGSSMSCDEYTTIVDAVFGIGLTREITGVYREMIENINRSGAQVAAIDIPSGISADNGQVMGISVCAHATITFAWEKIGTILYPGADYAGEVIVKQIGITEASFTDSEPKTFTYDKEDLNRRPKRNAYSNKGSYGKILLIAGSVGMSGAALLAAKAAYRSGAGIVKVMTPWENREIIQTALPEAIFTGYDQNDPEAVKTILKEQIETSTVLGVGPGMGMGNTAREIVQEVIKLRRKNMPTVIDADALNILAEQKEQMDQLDEAVIVTPHLGEMSRLVDQKIELLQKELISAAAEFAKNNQIQCILKDTRTIAATPDGAVYINTNGNSGMATAGSGDVLTGILAGLLAGGMRASEAAPFGVFLHGAAGDFAAQKKNEYSMMASDIIECL